MCHCQRIDLSPAPHCSQCLPHVTLSVARAPHLHGAAAADVSVIDVSDFEIVRGDVALGDVGIVSFILVDMAGSIFATADPLESLLSATKSNLKRMIINSE